LARGTARGTFAILTGQALTRAAIAIRVTAKTSAVALGRTEGRTDAAQTKDTAKGRGGEGFEGLASCGGGCEGFGQLVECGWVHLRSLLSQ
jgi:hypothetical protein